MNILVTGGLGFIGSHVIVELQQAGHRVTALDDLSNASPAVAQAIASITGTPVDFIEASVLDADALGAAFAAGQFDAVVHCAAFKSVAESALDPLGYYRNNVEGTIALLTAMDRHDVRSFVFSSSATVYAPRASLPFTEQSPTGPVNPYGQTKLTVEHILRDLAASNDAWRISILRYFNPVGAHVSGLIGERPVGKPNNLFPFIGDVATGSRPRIEVFGDDYDTPDGTGVRDYLHVVDLARGHLDALEYLEQRPGLSLHNLGTGRGYSVLEVIRAFEQASGVTIAYEIVGRRTGDIASSYADPAKAREELGWEAKCDLAEMCEDAWRWHRSLA